MIDDCFMPELLNSIGKVYGAEILHVPPRTYRDTQARLAGLLPLHAAVVCRHFVPHITVDAIPHQLPVGLICFCDGSELEVVQDELKMWIELCHQDVENRRPERTADKRALLLAIMIRGMLSHSKIGQFSHCQRQTVLTGVRARHLDCSAADNILDANSEPYMDGTDSDALFLWKEHNDGRQYFLNPRRVVESRTLAGQNRNQ